ncbi:MAG: dihydrolipoamide acetyltransferase family protein [Spirochaetaceae bacterium]|jgi:pyruvate dehydrogenase E2 component (dihydrolipoamide acetyltransferase)|nr:dihydrolipoamide acetyltransferase family protein [Spirochaetaceae bacterium]
MADKVLMPKQGNSVESCIIVAWLKKEGDKVAIGDIICEVETDKATIEVESSFEGTLLKTFYEEEDDVPVHNLIALIGEPGEDISSYSESDQAAEADAAEEKNLEVKKEDIQTGIPAAPVEVVEGKRIGSPRAMNLAAAKGIDIRTVAGSGPEGRVIERDILALTKEYPSLSPAAIEELLKSGKPVPVKGSGIGGRVLLSDVQNVKDEAVKTASVSNLRDYPGPVTEVTVRGIRKVTALHMMNSLSTTAQLTLNTSADATALLSLRKKFKNSNESLGLQKITINDLILFAVAKTLPRFPEMNEHFMGDTIRQFEKVHLGCAVNSEKGLLVPVIKDAGSYSLKTLSDKAKELFGAAAEGKSNPDDLQGGTFTITNLGSMGIESFTPVLNKPEVGILGVCAINLKPVQKDSEVEFIPYMGLSLTFDHQAVDGAPAAAFLQALVSAIENIDLLMAV